MNWAAIKTKARQAEETERIIEELESMLKPDDSRGFKIQSVRSDHELSITNDEAIPFIERDLTDARKHLAMLRDEIKKLAKEAP